MTQKEFYEQLAQMTSGVFNLGPGPVKLNIGEHDPLAAKLLLWMTAELLPETATVHDALEILDMARWWITFWQGIDSAEAISIDSEHSQYRWDLLEQILPKCPDCDALLHRDMKEDGWTLWCDCSFRHFIPYSASKNTHSEYERRE